MPRRKRNQEDRDPELARKVTERLESSQTPVEDPDLEHRNRQNKDFDERGVRRVEWADYNEGTPADPDRPQSEVDADILDDFAERQRLADGGSGELRERLREHHGLSPDISGGDVDALWEAGRMSGEETFTGHQPTPDQDVVDENGQAAGLTYRDDEPLNYGKVSQRDEKRWEMDPRSALESDGDDDDAYGNDEDDEDDEEDDEGVKFWDDADDLDAEVDEEDSALEEDEVDEDDDDEGDFDVDTDDDLEDEELDADEEDAEEDDTDLERDDLDEEDIDADDDDDDDDDESEF